MKSEKINIITIASSSNYKPSKEFEEMRNKQLTELYKRFQEKPFEYAKIDYFENSEPKVKIYRKGNFITRLFKKIFKFL
ncbi:MAG: hypothetical protein NC191_09165 [Muribaculaceae bacterium]|nr:hypothetical protein [Muribaculaceae bacterium]